MGSAADAISNLTGVKPTGESKAESTYKIPTDDDSPAASAMRNMLGIAKPSKDGSPTFADRFQPSTDAPLKPLQKSGFEWSKVADDALEETKKEAAAGVSDIGNLSNRGTMGPLDGLAATGKAAIAPLRILASPVTGGLASIGGHVMANAEHAAGSAIAPQIAIHDNPSQMYETAKGDVNTAMSAAGVKSPAVAAEAANTAAAAVPRSISELKAFASKGYEHPDLVGLEVKPEAIQNFGLKTELELSKKGLNDTSAPKVVTELRKAQNAPDGSTVTGQNIVSLRRSLGQIANDGGSEAKAAKTAIDHLDEWLPNIKNDHIVSGDPAAASEKLNQANADYTAAKHAELVDTKLLKAELRSASAHSGMGTTNQVRGRMADILINPKERRGFTQDELGQMEKIVYGTTGQNMLRGASNVLSGGGGVGSTLLGLMTGGTFPALGMALRRISNRLTVGQAQNLSEMIRTRPGLSNSVKKFEESAMAAKQAKDPRVRAGLVISARNLANNLSDAGIKISHSEILKGLESGDGSDNGE